MLSPHCTDRRFSFWPYYSCSRGPAAQQLQKHRRQVMMSLCAHVGIEQINSNLPWKYKNISQHIFYRKIRKIGQMPECSLTVMVLSCTQSLIYHYWSCKQLTWLYSTRFFGKCLGKTFIRLRKYCLYCVHMHFTFYLIYFFSSVWKPFPALE